MILIHDSVRISPVRFWLIVNTYSNVLMPIKLTMWLQSDIIEEGNKGTLKLNTIVLSVHNNMYLEQKLQPSIPDIVRRQAEGLNTGGTDKNTILHVKSIIFPFCKRPTLQTLIARIFLVPDLQSSVRKDVSLALFRRAQLHTRCNNHINLLIHVNSY
jgi:hypothetical protein